ncbi:MAG: hypothetical protein VYD19_06065 [Myxococcota bacterium]|nr:hypothetical protein [Myxococcota bacterium]
MTLSLILLSGVSPLQAGDGSATFSSMKGPLSPRLLLISKWAQGWAPRPASIELPERPQLLLRFTVPPSAEIQGDWEKRGWSHRRISTPESRPVFWRLQPQWAEIEGLKSLSHLERAELIWMPLGLYPSEEVLRDQGLPAVHARPLQSLSGEGAVIATLDTPIDPLHPHFFKADGGVYPWIDRDGDGRFTPGADGLDLNRNGRFDPAEVLGLIDSGFQNRYAEDWSWVGENRAFEPWRDWLFVDVNRDGRRNVGVEAGFTESDPAFGEPLFVVDDLNRNGLLDLDEKLVRLGSTKILQQFQIGER